MEERVPDCRYYEVSFKCTLRKYWTNSSDEYHVGEYVTVECEKGYDIGIISKQLYLGFDFHEDMLVTLFPILGKVEDDRKTMDELLKAKIIAENQSLGLCRTYCHGRKVGSFLEVIATEFQYDHKKLTLYVTKSGEVSVCKLVRKLFDSFHTRICVEEIQSAEEVIIAGQRYLELTQLDFTLSDIYFEPSRMPPQYENTRNNKGTRKNQRGQNGYTQSGANQSLLSALHQYRPNYTSGMNIAHPHTMGYSAPLPTRSNIPQTPLASTIIPPPNQGRFEQRFNERVYHPQPAIREMNMTPQYRMYDTYQHTPGTSILEADTIQYPIGVDYSTSQQSYYPDDTLIFPPNTRSAHYQSSYTDSNNLNINGEYSTPNISITMPYPSYPEVLNSSIQISETIALPLQDPNDLTPNVSFALPIAPNSNSSGNVEDGYPHYVVRY